MAKNHQIETVIHTFPPFYQKDSKILLLGSMPSRKSREQSFYYMHPQNRFWRVLSAVYQEELPATIEEKKKFLIRHQIALWDCILQCDIVGSSDASIKNVIPTDIPSILDKTNIKKIFTTGKKAQSLYEKYIYPKTKIEAISLPSTSPANVANYSLEDLVEIYKNNLK